MKITWLGHSCFILESGGFRALLDPYPAPIPTASTPISAHFIVEPEAS